MKRTTPVTPRRRLAVGMLSVALLLSLSGWASGWFIPTETTVTELSPGVFFRKTQTKPEFIGCNQGWVVFRDFVLVIDANFPNQADEVIKLIRKTTEEHLGKRLGVQMIRVLRVTEAAEKVNQTTELRAQMAHGPLTQFQYVSK